MTNPSGSLCIWLASFIQWELHPPASLLLPNAGHQSINGVVLHHLHAAPPRLFNKPSLITHNLTGMGNGTLYDFRGQAKRSVEAAVQLQGFGADGYAVVVRDGCRVLYG